MFSNCNSSLTLNLNLLTPASGVPPWDRCKGYLTLPLDVYHSTAERWALHHVLGTQSEQNWAGPRSGEGAGGQPRISLK